MSEWVVTFTVADEPSTIDRLDVWVDKLDEIDGLAARMPYGAIVITVHVSTDSDVLDIPREAWSVVVHAIGEHEVLGSEVMTEDEFARRAEAPTMPELMSAAEIADELGITRQRVHQLRHTIGFPAPLADLRGGAVWDAAAVRKFDSLWTRKPGRPATIRWDVLFSEPSTGTPGHGWIDVCVAQQSEADARQFFDDKAADARSLGLRFVLLRRNGETVDSWELRSPAQL